MSAALFSALGLTAPAAARVANPQVPSPPPPAGSGARAQAAAPAPAPTAAPRRTRITSITVAGRKLDLLGLVDKDGAVAQSGGKPPLDLLTEINRAAVALWKTNESTLLVRVQPFRAKVAAVRATTAKAAADFKKAHAGMVRGVKAQRDQGGGFFEDVNGYLVAQAEVSRLADEINTAQIDYKKSLAELESAIGLKGYEDGKDDVADKQARLDAKKAELAEAQAIFKTVLDIGKKVLEADWKGLADQAVGYLKDKAEEAVRDAILDKIYAVQIDKLTAELKAAKAKAAAAKATWLAASVEAATLGMESSAAKFDGARKQLRAALDNLARNQGNAVGALKRNDSTKAVGLVIEQRGAQLAAIGSARETLNSIVRVADQVIEQATTLGARYSRLPTDIGQLKDDPAYRSDSPWGKEVLAVAVINAALMVRVADAVGGLKTEANVALGYLGDGSAKGPLAPYNEAVAAIDTVLQG